MSAPFGSIPTDDAPAIFARPDSVPVGVLEHRIWRPLAALARDLLGARRQGELTKAEAWGFKDAVIAAAKQLDHDTKLPGEKRGKLGASAIKVLETLFAIVDLMTGRLEPTITTIAGKAKLARATVWQALKRLKDAGFLWWIRRKEALDNDGPGPQIHQAPNAYWFKLRGRAAGLVRLALNKRKPPVPDDVVAHQAQQREATEDMLARATAEEAARFHTGDSPLGDALASLGRAVDGSASSMIGRNPDRQEKESKDARR